MRLSVGLLNLALALGCCLPDQCDDQQTRSCVGAFDPVCETALWDTQCIEEAKDKCDLRCGCHSSTDDSVLASLRSLSLDDANLNMDFLNNFVSTNFSVSPQLEADMGSNATAGVTAGADMFQAVWGFLNAGATSEMATLHFLEDPESSTIAATVSPQGQVTRLITFHFNEQGSRLELASYLGFPAPHTLSSASFERIGRKYVKDFASIPENYKHNAFLLLRGELGSSAWPFPVVVPSVSEDDGCDVRIERMMAVLLASVVPAGVPVLDAARALISSRGENNTDLATKVQTLAAHFLEDEAAQQSHDDRIAATLNAEEEFVAFLLGLVGLEGILASFQPALSPEQFGILKVAIPLGIHFSEWSLGSDTLWDFRVLTDFNDVVSRAFAINRRCPMLRVKDLEQHHLASLMSKTTRGILQEQIDKHAPPHLKVTVDDVMTGLHQKLRSNSSNSTTGGEEDSAEFNGVATRRRKSDVCGGFKTRMLIDIFNIVLAGLLTAFRAVMVYAELAEMTTPIWRVITSITELSDGYKGAVVLFIQLLAIPSFLSVMASLVGTALAAHWWSWLLIAAEILATVATLVCTGGASVVANIALVGVAVGFLVKDVVEYKQADCTIEKPSGKYCYCDYPMDFSGGKNGFTCGGDGTKSYCPLNTYCSSYELFQLEDGKQAPCSAEPVCLCESGSMDFQGLYSCSDGTNGGCRTPGDEKSLCWNGQYCDRKGNQNCEYPLGMSFPKTNLEGHCLKESNEDVNSEHDYCQCKMPGSVAHNRYTCVDEQTQYCASNQYCLGLYPWVRKDTNANRCTEGIPRVTCKCEEPGNSLAGKNGYKCSDGSHHYCSDVGVSCNGMDFWLLQNPPCVGECLGVSYHAADKRCITKHYTCDNPNPGDWKFHKKSGYVAMDGDCANAGSAFGSPIKGTPWEKCKIHCDGEEGCVGFTYYFSPQGAGENVCYPKGVECSLTTLLEGKCPGAGCLYMKQAGAYTNMYGDCPGHDMKEQPADTLEACQKICNGAG